MSKINYMPSADKTAEVLFADFSQECWNQFKCNLGKALVRFVDIETKETQYEGWKNQEDVAVFILDAEYLNLMDWPILLEKVGCEEYDYLTIGKDLHIIRLWWD